MDIAQLIADFGFSVVMVVGLGYFVYFIWTTVTEEVEPSIDEMKTTIIRLTDQLRLLDQDMIRLHQKVNTVLELREKAKTALGEKFDIRKFHTIVLDNGIPPLFVLEELVEN